MRGFASRLGRNAALVLAIAACVSAAPAQAAFISFDDSDPDFITITAGDFEEGFFVNSDLLTIGLGNSASMTLADAGYSISGSWIDTGASVPPGRVDLLFAFPAFPANVLSGVEFEYATDGSLATLNGSFGGFTGITYFASAPPTYAQDGHTELGGAPFLSVSFTSEAPVPEPSTFLLFGGALSALGALRRRRRPRL